MRRQIYPFVRFCVLFDFPSDRLQLNLVDGSYDPSLHGFVQHKVFASAIRSAEPLNSVCNCTAADTDTVLHPPFVTTQKKVVKWVEKRVSVTSLLQHLYPPLLFFQVDSCIVSRLDVLPLINEEA